MRNITDNTLSKHSRNPKKYDIFVTINVEQLKDIQSFDRDLREKYKHSLFCFARAFANIYINNTFLKKSLNEYDRLKLKRFNNRLVNLRNRISHTLDDYYIFKNPPESEALAILSRIKEVWKDYFHYNEFLKRLDEEIEENEYLLSDPYYRTKRGIELFEVTKVALIFSSIIRGKSEIDTKSENKQNNENKYSFLQQTNYNIDEVKKRFVKFASDIRENIGKKDPNWDCIFTLMNWFYKNTPYRNILQKEEKTNIKDRIRKYTISNLARLLIFDFQYFISQKYFEEVSVESPIIIRSYENIYLEIYPAFSIEFHKDFIEIGEIEKKNLIYKRYSRSNSHFRFENKRTLPIETNEIPCEIIFPNRNKVQLMYFKV